MALPDFVKTSYIFEGKVQLVQHLYPSTLFEMTDPLMPEKLLSELFDRLKEGDHFTTDEVVELKKEYLANSKEVALADPAAGGEEQGITPQDKKKWSQRWLLDQFEQRIDALIEYAQQSGVFEIIENLDPALKDVLEPIQEKVGNFAEELWQVGNQTSAD